MSGTRIESSGASQHAAAPHALGHPDDKRSDRIHNPALDALRVVGALAVFVKHSSLATGQQLQPGYGWMNHFEIGPTIFFVLSAYLVYGPFVRALLDGREAMSVGRFAMRRVLRIVPLYWLALVVLYAVDHQRASGIGIKIGGVVGAIELATFTHIYDPQRFFNGIAAAYTLDVEVSFYVFVVAWVAVLHRWARRSERPQRVLGWALVGLMVFNALWRAAVGHWLRPAATVCSSTQTHWTCAGVNWLPGFLDYFVIGMALALAAACWQRDGPPRWLVAALSLRWLWLVIAGAMFWLYAAKFGTIGLDSLTGVKAELRHELNGFIVLILAIPAVFTTVDRGLVARVICSKAVRLGATFSYGFYLWHQGWIDLGLRATGARQFHGNFAIIATFAVFYAVLTAAVSWVLVERPIQHWQSRR